MTDAEFGSGGRVHIGLRLEMDSNNNTGTGGVKIELSNPPQYFITFCSDKWTEFEGNQCPQLIKTWTITKTSSSVSISCNLHIIAEYPFAKSSRGSCVSHWGERSGGFSFKKITNDGGDSASKKYRAKPATKSGRKIMNFNVVTFQNIPYNSIQFNIYLYGITQKM